MKKLLSICLTIMLLATSTNTQIISASSKNSNFKCTTEYLSDGSCYKTTMSTPYVSFTNYATNTITRTKTTEYYNANNKLLWSISITATFRYNGTSVTCTSCTPYHRINNNHWSVYSLSATHTDSSATTHATMSNTLLSGAKQTINKSVTIYCTPTGIVS